MRLNEYLSSRGDDVVAGLVGVTVRTVASWRYGERIPRPHHARKLVETSDGCLTLADVYASSEQAAA